MPAETRGDLVVLYSSGWRSFVSFLWALVIGGTVVFAAMFASRGALQLALATPILVYFNYAMLELYRFRVEIRGDQLCVFDFRRTCIDRGSIREVGVRPMLPNGEVLFLELATGAQIRVLAFNHWRFQSGMKRETRQASHRIAYWAGLD